MIDDQLARYEKVAGALLENCRTGGSGGKRCIGYVCLSGCSCRMVGLTLSVLVLFEVDIDIHATKIYSVEEIVNLE